MKKLVLALFLSFAFHLLSFSLFGQSHQGFMYGKITTFDDEVYEGQIRWGKEEAYWTDMFNASKIGNENIDYLTEEDLETLGRHKNWSKKGWGNWGKNWFSDKKNRGHYDDIENSIVHQFSCQFGEIKKIDLSRWKKVNIVLKDDTKIRVSGDGYNDIGTEVIIYDQKRGKVELDWSELLLVEFMPSPSNFESATGGPLYGTVETRQGSFTGLVQWDKDERVADDILDGRTRDRKRKFEFSEIASIEKFGKGCDVKLKNEREVFLYGSNDVNSENRGIVVSNSDFGRVVIDWSDFDRVVFHDEVEVKVPSYTDFKAPEPISGTVKTKNGKTISGQIVYDLDEKYEFELLNGDHGKIEFEIPFRNIQKIVPMRKGESLVKLKSQEEYELEDAQDVTSRNEGILVFENASQPIYISWRDVEEIVFN